ncbi:MAG: AzlD domain-containing protein [Actinomycetota bacterium]|nr:AzlD domain-containing protein [Actinomycetota bacterium]
MTDVWVTVFAICGALVVTKGIGPVALGNRDLPPAFTKVIDLLAPAILAALVAVGTFTDADGDLVLDARAAGLAAAGAVYAVSRRSILFAVGAAAVTAALVRALA